MIVMILKKPKARLKGEVSRWLLPVDNGVFAGRVSGAVRDALWRAALEKDACAEAIQVWSDGSVPEGFRLRQHGSGKLQVVDMDGMALVARPGPERADVSQL